jgi:hypothetical protein
VDEPSTMHRARQMWALFEPVHDVTYFSPEARAAFEEVGLRGFWRGYFAGRAAPLGPVGPGLVTALFYGFAPAHVRRAVPDVWSRADPDTALRARLEGARRALTRLLAGSSTDEVAAAADACEAAVARLEPDGRSLAGANLDLLPGDDPYQGLWQATTVLREHRGDGHVAALVVHGVRGLDVLVLRAGIDLHRRVLQPARGWSDEDWDAAAGRLVERELLGPSGRTSDTGRRLVEEVEAATDRAADSAWSDDAVTDQARTTLEPLAARARADWPDFDPIGLPRA